MIKRIFAALVATLLAGPALAAGGDVALTKRDWSFNGPFGSFSKKRKRLLRSYSCPE